MKVDIVDVEHGACAFIVPPAGGRLAMVDCGHNATKKWWPSIHFKYALKRTVLEYLFITNADHDHYSDLYDLAGAVEIHWFYRNWRFNADQFVKVKEEGGPLSRDARRYLELLYSHIHDTALSPPFDNGMGGITCRRFANAYGEFTDTNNLSMPCFFQYNGFQILFSGDLQVPGWKNLLQSAAFREALAKTTIFVASHHGREDGFCAEVFDYCDPMAIVMSDKAIEHSTQEGMASIYGAMVSGPGVTVMGSNEARKVLTTRSDGNIRFDVDDATHFNVWLHYAE